VFVDEFCKDFRIVLYTLFIQDVLYTLEEGSCQLGFFFPFDTELNHCTTGVEGFDDLVLVVAGEDKSTVVIKRLNISP
jgi:hypothetical protein